MLDKLLDLFTNCWTNGTLQRDLLDAIVFSLYKYKGEKSDCLNYGGITLPSIAGEILAHVSRQEHRKHARSKCDMIFVLRQIQ